MVQESTDRSRVELVRTVQQPLGFFVLVVLVVEVIMGFVASISSDNDRAHLIWGMILLIFSLIIIVSAMAVWRPESLRGVRAPPAHPVSSPSRAEAPEVLRVSKPAVLCAATKEFRDKGFGADVDIIKRVSRNSNIVHDLTGPALRRLLTENEFHIIHLLNSISPGDGTLRFSKEDKMSSDGFAALLDLCKVKLVVLASCDSVDLAAKVSRQTNIIAATTSLATRDFEQWSECFYGLLFKGHTLARSFEIARTTTSAPMVLLMKQDIALSF